MRSLLKKIIAGVIITGTMFSVCACPKISGKPYINDIDIGLVVNDGIKRYTESRLTGNFVCYKENDGKIMLKEVGDITYEVDPDGLCDVVPGKIYNIKYDVQRITGGIAGARKSYFLCVYYCHEIDCSQLFENDYYPFEGLWDFERVNRRPMFSHIDDPYIIVEDYDDSGFVVYSKRLGELHYDELREIEYPVLMSGNKEPDILQFNVVCNSDVTDEEITAQILGRKNNNGKDFLLYDTDRFYDEMLSDSYERVASSGYTFSRCYVYSDSTPEPGRKRIIYSSDLEAGKTADELGLPQDVFDTLYKKWDEAMQEASSKLPRDAEDGPHFDVVLFDGPFEDWSFIKYDRNFKLYVTVNNDSNEVPEEKVAYIGVAMRHEVVELFPPI